MVPITGVGSYVVTVGVAVVAVVVVLVVIESVYTESS